MNTSVELFPTESALKSAADIKDAHPARKHRGLWSFLTRTFVLGQLIVAEQFLGSAARAHDNDVAVDTADIASSASAGSGAAATALEGLASGDEVGTAGATDAAHAKAMAGAAPQAGASGIPSPGHAGADNAAESGPGTPVSVAAVALNGTDPGEADAGTGDPSDPVTPGYEPSPGGGDGNPGAGGGLEPIVLTPLEPVIELVDNVGGTVNDVLDTVETVVADVVETVQSIVAPTTEILTSTLGGTVDGVVEVATSTVDFAFDTVNAVLAPLPVVGEPLTVITGVVEDLTSTTLQTASTVATGAVAELGQTLNTVVADALPAVGNFVGSGVIPVLQAVVSSATDPDTLFEGGSYSDFNISLQSVEPVTGAVSDLGSAAGDVIEGAEDLLDLPSVLPVSTVASLVGDPLKGGLGDLFS